MGWYCTAQLQVTVVDCDVSRNLHVAPGALGVIVWVSALVSLQNYLWDERFTPSEGYSLW